MQTGIIRGQIVDNNGEPVSGATITFLLDAVNTQRVTTLSDFDGEFRVPGLPPGVYRILVDAAGYRMERELFINLRVGRIERIRISMVEGEERREDELLRGGPMITLEPDGIALELDRRIISMLPFSPDASDIAGLVPGFIELPDGVVVYGTDVRSNSWQLGGADISDPFSGVVAFEPDPLTVSSILIGGHNQPVSQGRQEGGRIDLRRNWLQNEKVSGTFGFIASGTEQTPDDDTRFSRSQGYATVSYSVNPRAWLFGSAGRSLEESTDQVENFARRDITRSEYSIRGRVQVSERNSLSAGYLSSGMESLNHFSPNLLIWDIRETFEDRITSDLKNNVDFVHLQQDLRVSDIMQVRLLGTWLSRRLEDFPTSGNRFEESMVDPRENILYSGNYRGTWQSLTADRLRADGSIDFYLDEIAGTHNVQLGMEIEKSDARNTWGYQGFFRTLLLEELEVARDFVAGTDGVASDVVSEVSLLRFSLYAQDTWFPASRIGITFGVRYNGPIGENSAAQTLDWDDISPRIAASYDLLGDGRLILRGGFARYHDAAILERTLQDPYGEGRQFWDRNLERLGYPLFGERNQRWASNYNAFVHHGYNTSGWMPADLDSDAPITDEFFLLAEYEPIENVAVGLNLVRRETNDLLEDFDIGFNANNRRVNNPAGNYEPVTGIGFDGTPYTWHRRQPINGNFSQILFWGNDDRLFRTYSTMELWWQTRVIAGFRFGGSYTLSSTRGNMDVDLAGSSTVSESNNNPSAFTHAEGYLSSDVRHRMKMAGTWAAPFDLDVGTVLTFQTGKPYDRYFFNPDLFSLDHTIRSALRGTVYRLDSQFIIDLRISKRLPLLQGSLNLQVDILNALDDRAITSVDQRDGTTFGQALTLLQSRTLQFLASYTF